MMRQAPRRTVLQPIATKHLLYSRLYIR